MFFLLLKLAYTSTAFETQNVSFKNNFFYYLVVSKGNCVKMVGSERRDERVVVAIDRGKGSQAALKWAVDNLVTSGESLTLVHVKLKQALVITGIAQMLIRHSFKLVFKLS